MKKLYILLLATICVFGPEKNYAQSAEWNLDFEEWDYNDTTPALWHDTIIENRIGLFPPKWHFRPGHIPEGKGLGQTTDATQGNYAVTLSGFYQYQVMRIISGESADKPGWPIHFKPNKFIGDYKVILLGNNCDSLRAYVSVFLTSYNTINGGRDTVGQGNIVLKETSTSYEQFEIDINYLNNFAVPDTIIIVLAKERFGFDNPPACLECSHVYFDNLQLTTKVSAQDQLYKTKDIEIFPNPASGSFVIRLNRQNQSYNISVLASNGQFLQNYSDIKNEITIDTGNLTKGVFFLRIENKASGECTYEKVIVE